MNLYVTLLPGEQQMGLGTVGEVNSVSYTLSRCTIVVSCLVQLYHV